MASIIPGYEYDVFISYRQKDNKHDGWVTKFVEKLKGELDATFKKEISIYFDENPHDRLQETHDVSKSLEGKLKCLIFIPILSQTYCDPNSYAWQYEFLAFNKLAREDRFSRDIKLRKGNYASRILPVQIHDLEPEDIQLFENETGSVLRAMDFVFKTSTGVNRPLQSDEDRPNDNLNKTFYRDQVNKVANAIKEIILSLKKVPDTTVQGKDKIPPDEIQSGPEKAYRQRVIKLKSKRFLIMSLSLLLCIAGVFAINKVINRGKHAVDVTKLEKSIAVLPFANDSPDKENEYFCNGMMEEILHQLQKISALKVKARTSVEKYRNTDKDIMVIGRELEVSLIMEGSVRKAGDDLRITAQLIDAKTGDHLWSEIYNGKYTTDIFEFQSSVAKKVASSLNIVIAPQEEKRIDDKPTTEILAYDLCAKGNDMINRWRYTFDSFNLKLALNLFNEALQTDPGFIDALDGKGVVYTESGKFDSALFCWEKIDKIDPKNSNSTYGKALIYLYSNQPDSALKYWQKAIDLEPNNQWLHFGMGQTFIYCKNDPVKGLPFYQKACDLGGASEPEINRHLAIVYFYIGDYVKAMKYLNNALSQEQECKSFLMYDYLMFAQGQFDAALSYLDSTCSINACEQGCDIMKFYILTTKKEYAKAERIYKKALEAGHKNNGTDDIFIACIYNETGRKKEAFKILKNSIERDEIAVKNSTNPLDMDKKLRIAAAWSIMGENKKALIHIPEAGIFELGEVNFNRWDIDINTFPGFDNLRNDPEFKAIVKRIEDEKTSLRAQVREMEKRGELHL